MDLTTLTYTPGPGWSEPLPALDSERTLVLAFGAPELRDAPGPLEELSAAYPSSVVLACSTAGEIHGERLTDGGLVVAVVRFAETRLARSHASVVAREDSFTAGRRIVAALDRPGLRAMIVLSDGHVVNGSALVRGLTTGLSPDVVVTGGLAGDGPRFERTWVLQDGRLLEGVVAAVGLYGDALRVGHGSRGGWDDFGPVRRVTRSDDNVVHELDGRPALALYKEYLGELAGGLPAAGLRFPLALRDGPDDSHKVVRTILSVDEDTQSLVFAGDVPEGAMVQLMRANTDRLVDGAAAAGEEAGEGAEGPVLSIGISCVGRRLVLGERTEEEIEAVLDALPAGSRQIGFYSYGEISPGGGRCELHNQTMTLTTLSERV